MPASMPGGRPGHNALLLVAGPTCSGKSALALDLATRFGGVVINADSMQLYRELRILTARPDEAALAAAPHALYGVRPAAEAASAAWWRGEALRTIAETHRAGLLPILCGGTGLYFDTLRRGLAPIPDPGEAARTQARALLAELGPASLHAWLAARDPATAATLRPSDSQRLARAAEVLLGTGQGLAAWHSGQVAETAAWPMLGILLDPPRDGLRQAIEQRCRAMVAEGALDEVAALMALGLDPALPAMRAHGVREFAAHLAGEATLEDAMARTVRVTVQYTKRQATWFRHRPPAPGEMVTIGTLYGSEAQARDQIRPEVSNFIARRA